ncbi:MAG TPA: 16S rRNA (cytosine(1402)-N(4))-methyltransferase RsmH [Phycisphaerales bacterium]|nr:16S rRNA (cytosine(1402)-N(4))-methyltransferase RsmH [Phycisphaerales bacterium]
MNEVGHIPVLLDEVLRLLDPKPGEVAVDLTAGRGGHSLALAQAVRANGAPGRVIGFDLDKENLAFAAQRLEAANVNFTGIHESFINAPGTLRSLGVKADVVLADLGFSSNQMDDPERGFSFSADGPLDMRLNPADATPTAADLLASLSERELADVIFQYGEDPFARRIARNLVESRQFEPIRTTARLARLVHEAYGPKARSSRMHPATRTFMALRIAVNDELGALRSLLDQITKGAENVNGPTWLHPGARVGIISFHSLEDRLVKHAFADIARRGLATRLTKRPVSASEQEASANPRSRSAKLRVARIGDDTR